MPKTKPPRKPRGENKAVTIKNQDAQIRLLIARMEELGEFRDKWQTDCRVAENMLKQANLAKADLYDQVSKLQAVIARMEGWRDLAREILGQIGYAGTVIESPVNQS